MILLPRERLRQSGGVQMPRASQPDDIEWFRYPLVAATPLVREWLTTEILLGLAPNTLAAYARGLDDFLGFCQRYDIEPERASRSDLARYVNDLRERPHPHLRGVPVDLTPSAGLSNATLQQRLTAVRLFFDFLIEEGKRTDHPVGRGKYTPGNAYGADRTRSGASFSDHALAAKRRTMESLLAGRQASASSDPVYGSLCLRCGAAPRRTLLFAK